MVPGRGSLAGAVAAAGAAALAVFAALAPCCGAATKDDILATKVWLDQHVFNSTLKTTKLPGGSKVWMTSGDKAREQGLDDWPPAEWPTLCFIGLGVHSIEFLVSLAQLFPELKLVLLDYMDESYVGALAELLGDNAGRVEIGRVEDFAEARGKARRSCKAISWSVDTPPFSFYRYRELFYSSPFILALFNMQGCTAESRVETADKYYCEYLYTNFQTTLCGKLNEDKSAEYNGQAIYFPMVDAGCGENICMCNAHSDAFIDFHFETLCRKGEPPRYISQWGQDQYLLRNVFKMDDRQGKGFYVDIGASHPYHLSNTAFFDQCLEWEGICMEPNPRSKPILKSLRSCEVVSACAWANESTIRFANGAELAAMTDDETLKPSEPYSLDGTEEAGGTYFEARCAPLHTLLSEALLAAGRRRELDAQGRPIIDLLSVDAEGAEVEIFRNFPFQAWNIRAVVVETSRETAMAIDSLFLPEGFLKVAVLGKDAVYLSRSQASALPVKPELPETIAWNEPGTDNDYIEYRRFQRLFGVDGDLDVDVGDQRLLNETELDRQQARLDAAQAEIMEEVVKAAEGAAIGGKMSEEQLRTLEEPWVKEALRDQRVKDIVSILFEPAPAHEQDIFRRLEGNARLKAKVVRLLEAGVLVHPGLSKALDIEER